MKKIINIILILVVLLICFSLLRTGYMWNEKCVTEKIKGNPMEDYYNEVCGDNQTCRDLILRPEPNRCELNETTFINLNGDLMNCTHWVNVN